MNTRPGEIAGCAEPNEEKSTMILLQRKLTSIVRSGQKKPASSEKNGLSMKDKLTITISIIALLISLYTFLSANFLDQHVFKGSVVSIDWEKDSLVANILLVNNGKSYETLYSARFIFGEDISSGGGTLSPEKIGPIVVPPNQAILAKLQMLRPNIDTLHKYLVVPASSFNLHLGVLFDVIDKNGNLPEDGKIYHFTVLKFDSSGLTPSAGRKATDDSTMIRLL